MVDALALGTAVAEEPDDGWAGNRPIGVWGGRNGRMYLVARQADPDHPVLVDTE